MGSLDNIHPEEIVATETYHYVRRVRKNGTTKISEAPKGIVRVKIPYDGWQCFPRQAAEELREKKNLVSLKIGSLAIGEPKNWTGSWRQQIGVELLDVDIPLRTDGIEEEQWSADELVIECDHEYNPDAPTYYPIQVQLQVLDRYVPDPTSFAGEIQKTAEFWDEIAEASANIRMDNTVRFIISISVKLPSILGDNMEVHVEKLIFNWSKIPPRTQFRIAQTDRDGQEPASLNWDYAPDHNEIIVGPIKMRANPKDNGNPLRAYYGNIRMDLQYASGKLLEEDKLQGKAIVCVEDILLSGRDVAWINAGGRRLKSNPTVKKQTRIECAFEAFLLEQFSVKRSFISRQWIFPGVSRQAARVYDVAAILLDMGYSDVELNKEEYWVAGKRQVAWSPQKESKMNVWIKFDEKSTLSTTRERKLEEAETYRTQISTTELTLNFYALMDGAGEILSLDAENLMQRLKDQFAVVADLQ